MVGMLIGAGILAMPYVIYQAGFWTGMLVLFFIGFSVLLMHLYIGEIVLRTKGKHQLVGYVEKYLGKKAKYILTFSLFFMLNGGLAAYILGGGAALKALLGGNEFFWSLIFFSVLAVIVFFDLKAVSGSEVLIGSAMIITIALICVLSVPSMDVNNLKGFNLSKFFIPYGVIFFSIVGGGAVPQIRAELKNNKKKLKKAVILGTLIPLGIYALFSLVVIAVVGQSFDMLDQGVATVALGFVLGSYMNWFVNLFAVFSIATSFLSMVLIMKWVYQYDYKLNKKIAWGVSCIIPLIIVLLNWTTFVRILGLIGAVGGGVEGIMIILMHYKAKKFGERKPEYEISSNFFISGLLICIFIIGIIATIVI